MRNLLYIVAVILIIIWALGSFAYHVGSALIHLLLVVAVIAIVVNIFKNRKP
ncbi:lmo0937 family membrane protein [Flavobacterium sp. MK4S-17]|jgi:Co/Zn/Cd efflux system component|uniref:lmo0937 family membrane protein n=1 Tax=Flavobacterium sp. MK4S-17 TaxID=2543737 RepID=UPI001356FD75|nr:lmo0937 family membrane protein [Flavobacterium sp. MK4S-17]